MGKQKVQFNNSIYSQKNLSRTTIALLSENQSFMQQQAAGFYMHVHYLHLSMCTDLHIGSPQWAMKLVKGVKI